MHKILDMLHYTIVHLQYKSQHILFSPIFHSSISFFLAIMLLASYHDSYYAQCLL